jgi:predicted membrane protein
MGKVTLDFEGAWTSSSQAAVKMAVGELTLRLPRRVGLRLVLDRFLASFDPAGLERVGNAFQSAGYDRAERRLEISVTTAIGGVKVEWADGRSVKSEK